MSNRGQEIEAKFYVRNLDGIITRLQLLRAYLIQPRVLETNLRFDLPDGSLRSSGRVLRLRRDTEARLTYKSASRNNNGVLERAEVELTVEDFQKANEFLEALGYRQVILYEKYRTTYEIEGVQIMLDELPYGNFVEIEGESLEQIQVIAAKLELDWGTAIGMSYTALFETVSKALHLPFRDLSFQNFEGIHVTASHLNVRAADG